MTVEKQKRVLLAAIEEAAQEAGDRRNVVPLQKVGEKLWPPRDDNDPRTAVAGPRADRAGRT